MGLKDRRTKILLALILLYQKDQFVLFSPSILALFDLSLNKNTFRTFRELIQEDLVVPEADTQENLAFRLTSQGFEAVYLLFPYFRFLYDKWDGQFRILSYEIPESKRELRDRLRREVASWGLGPWHRSFWVTPHPIIPALRRLVSDREEEQYVQAFESQHVFGNQSQLIQKVWNKDALELRYRSLFKTWHQTLSKDSEKLDKMKSVLAAYVDILKADPGLPKQLVGESWIGFEGYALFHEIKDILLG